MVLGLSIRLLDPAFLAVGLVGLVPLAVGTIALHRSRDAARAVGLPPSSLVAALVPAGLAAAACVIAGIAAAQPVLRTVDARPRRVDSETMFLVDVSRSMRASASPEAPTRLDQARDVVATLRAAVPDVPTGIAGFTDRSLPYIFPTADRGAFARALERSVRAESPPPEEVNTVATTFAAVPALARDGFFTRGKPYRTCVVVTDGEARTSSDDTGSSVSAGPSLAPVDGGGSTSGGESVDPAVSGAALAGARGCRLIVVRVGSTADRLYLGSGRAEPQYRPDEAAASKVERFAESAGGAAFPASELGAAARRLQADAERGPVAHVARDVTDHALAPYAAGAAALLAVGVALARTARAPRRRLRVLDGAE